jgi:hypothetical protein
MTKKKNQRYTELILLNVIVSILCFIFMGKAAFAMEQIDQSNLPEWAGGWTHVNPSAEGRSVMWQTFTPSRPNLTAVEIDILTISPGRGDDTLTIEIAKDGDILATADCYVEDGFDGLLRFEFPETVPLVPEQIYKLMVRDTGTVRFGWKYASNTYERGSRYVIEQEQPGTDWLFQTYSEIEPAQTKYSGGKGEPNTPYQIATAEDLMLLGETPEDYDKHFILTADIDLDPNLPGYRVFDSAVIARDTDNVESGFQGTPFAGVFDGMGHTIAHLSITGDLYLGLFGQLASGAKVRDLGLVEVNITNSRSIIGGLAGVNNGSILRSYSTGEFSGEVLVGGLVGSNNGSIASSYSTGKVSGDLVGGLVGWNTGTIIESHSVSAVNGNIEAGGLVGLNRDAGSITGSYSTGVVTGDLNTGGLVARSDKEGSITMSFSTAIVNGNANVGGLVGHNDRTSSISNSYSTGAVNGGVMAGGLVGNNAGSIIACYSTGAPNGDTLVGGLVGTNLLGSVTSSFWDVDASGLVNSQGGAGKTTAEMQMDSTFLEAGWDFVGETENSTDDIWKMWDGYDYPRLKWEPGPNTPLVFVDVNDPGFYGQMSKYEVTNAQYCDFLNAALASGDIIVNGTEIEGANGSNDGEDYVGESYYKLDGSGWTGAGATNGGASRIHYNEGTFIVDSGFSDHPVTYVSWYGAMAFASYYGYYLPTEDQWQAVADYDGTYIYGCGETIYPGIANYVNSEYPDGTTSVGSFGRYGYGMSDIAGNVWEWVSSGTEGFRIFRGGGWYSYDYDCAVSISGDGIPNANYCDIGFRVCR